MSVHVSSWAWRQKIGDTSAKMVLLKLADMANDEGLCWPSQRYLAEHCEMSDRNVRFKLDKLIALGLLQVKQTKNPDGTWHLNLYELSSGSPLPTEPEENRRKPTSSETLIETNRLVGSPLPTVTCPQCAVPFNGTDKGRKRLSEHMENVHGVIAV